MGAETVHGFRAKRRWSRQTLREGFDPRAQRGARRLLLPALVGSHAQPAPGAWRKRQGLGAPRHAQDAPNGLYAGTRRLRIHGAAARGGGEFLATVEGTHDPRKAFKTFPAEVRDGLWVASARIGATPSRAGRLEAATAERAATNEGAQRLEAAEADATAERTETSGPRAAAANATAERAATNESAQWLEAAADTTAERAACNDRLQNLEAENAELKKRVQGLAEFATLAEQRDKWLCRRAWDGARARGVSVGKGRRSSTTVSLYIGMSVLKKALNQNGKEVCV